MTQSKWFCCRCNKGISFFHSSWEGINRKTKTHWFVHYCPVCGNVTSVETSPFGFSNLIPRIGRWQSVLFNILLGSPFLTVAWMPFGWEGSVPIGGIIVTPVVLFLAITAAFERIYETEECPYQQDHQYLDLVHKKKGEL